MPRKTQQYFTKNDMLYGSLKEKILSGAYRAGERLIVADIASEFSVSPMPVREALQRLQQDGWVEITPHVGARVAIYDKKKYLETIEVRRELESMAVRLSAGRISQQSVEQLFEILNEMEECCKTGDTSSYTMLNRQFHDTIYNCCGNETLVSIINDLIAKTGQSQSIFFRSPERMVKSTRQHRAIAEAIRDKRSEEAGELMYNHKREGFDITIQLLEENN